MTLDPAGLAHLRHELRTPLNHVLGYSEMLLEDAGDAGELVTALQRVRGEGRAVLAVVEDDAATRSLLERALTKAGWIVAEAENGRVALERIAESRPALVLLDLMMPEMDGFDFVAAVRDEPAWRSVPIVVITAKSLSAEDHERLNGYVARVLQKGALSRETLLGQVRDLVAASTHHGRRARRPA